MKSIFFFLSVQDIPFFFTLQNSSHVVSYVILKVINREVRAHTACWMLESAIMCSGIPANKWKNMTLNSLKSHSLYKLHPPISLCKMCSGLSFHQQKAQWLKYIRFVTLFPSPKQYVVVWWTDILRWNATINMLTCMPVLSYQKLYNTILHFGVSLNINKAKKQDYIPYNNIPIISNIKYFPTRL